MKESHHCLSKGCPWWRILPRIEGVALALIALLSVQPHEVHANLEITTDTLHQQGGTLRIGASSGTMTVHGDYLLSDGGRIDIEIGGYSHADYDQLFVAGDATLGGSLAVTLLDDFYPVAGDVFEILTADSIDGKFSALNLPTLDGGLFWRVDYGQDSVRLVVAVPEPSSVALASFALAVVGVWRRRVNPFLSGQAITLAA